MGTEIVGFDVRASREVCTKERTVNPEVRGLFDDVDTEMVMGGLLADVRAFRFAADELALVGLPPECRARLHGGTEGIGEFEHSWPET